jgi:hypothetical protein
VRGLEEAREIVRFHSAKDLDVIKHGTFDLEYIFYFLL